MSKAYMQARIDHKNLLTFPSFISIGAKEKTFPPIRLCGGL
jgi:hypothetical protein